MKIEQCQKKAISSSGSFIKTPERNASIIVLQKGARFIDSYNSVTRKSSNHFGDADTYFQRTLRSYEDYDCSKNCHLDLTFANNSISSKTEEAYNRRYNRRKQNPEYFRNQSENSTPHTNSKPILEVPKTLGTMNEEMEETETTAGEEDEEMREVDEMIVKASQELEQVAEENQQLLKILDKPIGSIVLESEEHTSITNDGDEESQSATDRSVINQLEYAEQQAKDTANVIYELKTRVAELLKREELTEEETKELDHKNKKLKEQMTQFEKRTREIQFLIEKTNIMDSYILKNENTDDLPRTKFQDAKQEKNSKNLFSNSNQKVTDSVKSGFCSCCSENLRQTVQSVPSFAKKLCQSYTMQEKLAAENADLESVRFKLQEELLKKDQTLECLQRELGNLQNEMRLVSRENIVLNENLKKLQQKEMKSSGENHQKPLDNSVVSTKLQEYSDNTYQLEKQLTDMENDVKYLHEEICEVQKEREHLEKHRKMMCLSRPCMTPYLISPFNIPKSFCAAPFCQSNSLSKGLSAQVLNELRDQYDKLENNLKLKLSQVVTLKSNYEKLKNLTKDAEEFKKITEHKMKDCEKIMKGLKSESKISIQQEQQLVAAKMRFKKAQDSLKEQQVGIKEQKKHLEDLRIKYLEAQQQLEEQRNQINIKFENNRGTSLNLGAQIFTNLQEKLEEMII